MNSKQRRAVVIIFIAILISIVSILAKVSLDYYENSLKNSSQTSSSAKVQLTVLPNPEVEDLGKESSENGSR